MRVLSKNIKGLIARNKIAEAISLLIRAVDEFGLDCELEATLLSRDFYGLKNASSAGKLNWEEEERAKRSIAYKLIELVTSIEKK